MANERGEHGWFKPGEHSYAPLLRSNAVELLAKSYPASSRSGNLYALKWFLDFNQVGPEELLDLSENDIKQGLRRAILQKNSEQKYSVGRRVFYVVRRFLELNNRAVDFTRTERKTLFKRQPKKISKQHIPTRDEVYRMADAVPNKGPRQHARSKAIILCLWQSGVRGGCLCSWVYGMFNGQLYPEIKVPVRIKVVAHREPNVTDCAEDTKLSAYNVNYYYTFLHREAAEALRAYLNERMEDGWEPKLGDPIFVTEGTASKGVPLDTTHLLGMVKSAAQQIGVDPDSIWTHCFRKAFRKNLYRSGMDPDCAEGLMGHKLPGSRGSYFDYHDVGFAEEEYSRCYWERVSVDRHRLLERKVAELNGLKEQLKTVEEENKALKTRMNGITAARAETDSTMNRLFEDPEFKALLKRKLKELT